MTPALLLALALAAARAADPLLPRDTTLANGLRVRVIEDSSLPLVSVLLMVPGGAAHDPADRLGASSLTARLIAEGTAHRDALAVAEAFEDLGTSLDVSAGATFTTLSASFLTEDWAAGLGLIAEVATRPRLAAADLGPERTRALQDLTAELDDAGALAGRLQYRALYGDHPFGRPEGGTEAGLLAVTAEDLRAFHEARYRPGGSVLCVVGDVRAREAAREAEASFRGWRGVAADPGLPPPPAPWSGVRKALVDLPGQTQVQVRIARRTVPRAHPDHEALRLGAALLGGGFTSRLIEVLRVEHALTYSADASVWSFDRDAVITASTFSANETAREALDLAWREVRGWRAGGWGDEEYERARSYTLGMVPQVLETRDARAWTLAVMSYQGLPADHMARRVAAIGGVARADAEAAVARDLPTDGWLVLVVGDLEFVRLQLEDFEGGGWEILARE
jgi:zinc protease